MSLPRAVFRTGLVIVFLLTATLFASTFVVTRFRSDIVMIDDAHHAPIAIVLGAKVKKNEEPSDILRDRLLTAVDLYQAGLVDKVLVSGDDGQPEYDEVNVMRTFMLKQGIAPEDLFLD
ncbi:MAG: ElyC/SanA/YdcF family protein, partial [Patescibacteria group bacterium]